MAQTYPQKPFEAPAGATEILLVRHGQSQAADPDRPFDLVDGHGDPPLSELGHQQAKAVGERLRHEPIGAVYHTKLQRTLQTATPLLGHSGHEPRLDPGLHEVFLGDWEGGLFRKMAAEDHPAIVRMRTEGEWGHIPGAETTEELRHRTVSAIVRIHSDHPDQRVAVFVHGGVIAALLHRATGSRPFAFMGADNGSIHHLVVHGDEWQLRRFNDTSHMGGFTAEGQGLT
ncbi:MAG: histidine phosphatase family protein [Actinomycetia bacterium]|nr:histidine phosphatase family protein [Actinomycetes bacterium]